MSGPYRQRPPGGEPERPSLRELVDALAPPEPELGPTLSDHVAELRGHVTEFWAVMTGRWLP